MKRTNVRILRVPRFLETSDDQTSPDDIDEVNARSYDYARRTAMPTLDEYILSPFNTALKERAFAAAEEDVGRTLEGILNEASTLREHLHDKTFVVRVYPTETTKYEIVLSLTKDFLDTARADIKRGVSRDKIIQIEYDAHIHLNYLLDEMKRFKENHSTRFNRSEVSIRDPQTDKPFPLDDTIEQMRVYLDLTRFSHINRKNADAYYAAQSLRAQTTSYLSAFREQLMSDYNIPASGLKERHHLDYELTDGSAVRYLFFPNTSTEHGKIHKGLIGKETKNIAASTGDLDILHELTLDEPYEYLRGGAGIIVNTQTHITTENQTATILRRAKDGTEDVRTYSFVDRDTHRYVRITDVLETLETLAQRYTTTPTAIKIDFFAAPPAYLR